MIKKYLFLILTYSLHAQLLTTGMENKNVKRVLNNINALYESGTLSPGLAAALDPLVGEPTTVINRALDQLHPAQYSALVETQVEIGANILSYFHRKPYLPCHHERPNRLWAEPNLNWLEEKRYGKQRHFNTDSWGMAGGYDHTIGDNGIIGFGGAYNHNEIKWHPKRGTAHTDSFYGAVYLDGGSENLYVALSAMGGIDFNHVKRHIDFLSTDVTAKSNYKAIEWMGQLSAAYLCGTPAALFYPFANADFFYLNARPFHEHGADGLDLKVHSNISTAARIEEGIALQVQDTNAAETACISPFISLSWVSIIPMHREKYEAEFEGETLSFKASGWHHTWQLLSGQFGLRFDYKGSSFNFGYRFELSTDNHKNFFDQRGDARVEIKW